MSIWQAALQLDTDVIRFPHWCPSYSIRQSESLHSAVWDASGVLGLQPNESGRFFLPFECGVLPRSRRVEELP
jgi:hypothetical protein